jgi:hypothetical protein
VGPGLEPALGGAGGAAAARPDAPHDHALSLWPDGPGGVGLPGADAGGLPDDLASRNRLPSETVPAAITLICVPAFAFGHRQGKEKAAVEGRKWLELDG